MSKDADKVNLAKRSYLQLLQSSDVRLSERCKGICIVNIPSRSKLPNLYMLMVYVCAWGLLEAVAERGIAKQGVPVSWRPNSALGSHLARALGERATLDPWRSCGNLQPPGNAEPNKRLASEPKCSFPVDATGLNP